MVGHAVLNNKIFPSFMKIQQDNDFSCWKNNNLHFSAIVIITPTPWLTLRLVLGKSRVKQNSC
jgi:hypothetical protein